MVTGLVDGRVVAWEAKRAERAPAEILSIDAHKGAVTALSFPKQVGKGSVCLEVFYEQSSPVERAFFAVLGVPTYVFGFSWRRFVL